MGSWQKFYLEIKKTNGLIRDHSKQSSDKGSR